MNDQTIPGLPKEAYAVRSAPFIGVDLAANYRRPLKALVHASDDAARAFTGLGAAVSRLKRLLLKRHTTKRARVRRRARRDRRGF